MSILGWLILGLVSQVVARRVSNKRGKGVVFDNMLGVVSAVVGGWLFAQFGEPGITRFNLSSMVAEASDFRLNGPAAIVSHAAVNGHMLDIRQIPILNDNYIYLIREPGGCVAVVDPAGVTPVTREAERLGWTITHILNTHHHPDHVGGNVELKWLTKCQIVGPAADPHRIPGMDVKVSDGDVFKFGTEEAEVFFVPGHTRGHIAYWFKDSAALFCGDTLFSIGCGRLFEGTPEEMWNSLSRLRRLPPETRVYCAHEYTESNISFALTVEPNNQALRRRSAEVQDLRAKGLPTVPSRLGDEIEANPFLRADVPALQAAIGMAGKDPVEVFATVRRQKDTFKAV